MKVAIACWQGRVAPVFDVAGNLLLVDVSGGVEQGRKAVALEGDAPQGRARQLVQLGADVLICGAISRPLEMALTSARVKVIPQKCGEIEPVVEAFIRGRLHCDLFRMPGCSGRRPSAPTRRCSREKASGDSAHSSHRVASTRRRQDGKDTVCR